MTLHIIPQSHIDLAWWWRYDPETLDIIVKHTLETAYGNMEKFHDYTFTYLQVPAIEPLENRFPDLFYKLRYYAHNPRIIGEGLPNPDAAGAKGRLAIGSASWCEFDGCLPCGESLVRQFLHGKLYFQRNFGIDVKTAWVQDAWTHPWTLPQIMKKCGVDSYMFTRPRGEGEPMFWWESPDGSRVFAYKPLAMENSLPPQNSINERLLNVGKRYGVRDGMVMVGVGNHGGGAIRADVERMRSLMAQRMSQNTQDATPPKMIFSTPSRYVNAVLGDAHPFPVVKNELPSTIRGSYTSVGEIKKGNRRSECLLMTLEKFSSIAARLDDRPYPQALLLDAWKKVMLNQFHDTISGTEIPPAVDDALLRYRQIAESCQSELQACLKAISARIDTRGTGTPLVVFNPLTWERTDAVEMDLDFAAIPANMQLIDSQGRHIPIQKIGDRVVQGKRLVTVAFVAESVPSLGYKTYWLQSGQKDAVRKSPEAGQPDRPGQNEYVLENAYFRVRIDPISGCVQTIFDKEAKREVLAENAKGNLIQIFEDLGDSEGFLKSPEGREHNDWNRKCWNVDTDPQIALVESGPVRSVLEIKKKFELATFLQRVVLYQGLKKIDFDLTIDWNGENKMVKIAFPLAISSPEATYEIPYGTIRRSSQGEEEVAQNWVDIASGNPTAEYGVSLLNDSRYGYDVTPNTLRLSVLRSPTGPVSCTDTGRHVLKYSLYPHRSSWQNAGVVQRGQELNNPLISMLETSHSGDLPATFAFVTVEPENVILSVLKKAEDGEHWIARCYETEGKATTARVTLASPLNIETVHATDMLESSRRDIPIKSGTFSAETPAYAIDTYKLIEQAGSPSTGLAIPR
jgi:alpha-mannosidase